MEEKDLKKRIEEQSEEIRIPITLEPVSVMKSVEERARKRRMAYYKKITAAAACCAVVAGVGIAGAAGLFGSQGDGAEDGALATADEPSKSENEAAEVTAIASAKDYDEIYSFIEAENERMNEYAKTTGMGVTMEAKSEVAQDTAAGEASYGYEGSGYSDTNIREEGVGEGDIVKTDGDRIYVLNNRRIDIVDISGEELQELGEIELNGESYVSEIFVKNDRLIAVYSETESPEETETGEYVGVYREYTVAETFDISNPAKPKSIGKISQSGNFHTMRVVGDYVYMLSNYYPDMQCGVRDVASYIPSVQGKMMESTDIFLPSQKMGSQYTVITSFSLDDPEEKSDSKAVFGTNGMCYVSGENIYICESDYGYGDSSNDVTSTWIRKISYKDGELKAVGQTKVDGLLNDSFSIDEYKSNLRLVTSVSYNNDNGVMPISLFRSDAAAEEETAKEDSNTLYVLDKNLKELSRIEGLAEDEQVYSARFMGDTGYFVTYKQVDPLFSVDLSNPKNPKILGELKIPGFSEYLHPYGEGKLLGIGMDVDETGTTTNGVKLSMFDISDPKDVEEVHKYVLEGTYSTDVAYNYKAALIDVEKNLIGFTAYGDIQYYYIFSYDENGFTEIFKRELTGMSSDVRGIYAGENLYLVAGNTIESYQLDTFEKIDDIVL